MTRRRPHRTTAAEAVADDQPIPLGHLDDPTDIDALRAAIALRAARADAGEPSAEFVDRLHDRLTAEARPDAARRRLSRRTVLTGAVAAGSVAAGIAVGVVAERTSTDPHEQRSAGPLEPTDGEWVAVASVDALGARPVRFESRGVIGFVSGSSDALQAVSGVCTHLGCVLRANDTTGRLDCPCHRTSFETNGAVADFQLQTKPAPLPVLHVRRQGDTVEVLLPPSAD